MLSKNNTPKLIEYLFLAVIVLFSFCLYAYKIESLPMGLHGDEAEPGLEAQKIIRGDYKSIIGVGWYSIPLVNFLLPAVSIKIFGQTVFALRIVSAFCGALTLIPFYFLAKVIFQNSPFSLISTLLLATSHYYIAFSRLGLVNIQVVFWEVSSFLFILKALLEDNKVFYILAGLFVGLGLYSYLNFRVVPIIIFFIFLHQIIVSTNRLNLGIKALYFIISGLIIFSPMLFYYHKHPGAFLTQTRTMATYIFSDEESVQNHIKNFYPNKSKPEIIFAQAQKLFNLSSNSGDTSGMYSYRGRIFDPLTLILLFIGLGVTLLTLKTLFSFFLIIWFSAILFCFGILTTDPPFWPRLIGVLPVIFIFVGLGLKIVFEKIGQVKFSIAKILAPVILISAITSILLVNFYTYFVKSKEYMPDHVGSRIASVLNSLGPGYKIVFLTAPYFYSNFGSILFQAPAIKTSNINEPQGFIPYKITDKQAFIIHPQYVEKAILLKKLNPEGSLLEIKSFRGQTQFYLFKSP